MYSISILTLPSLFWIFKCFFNLTGERTRLTLAYCVVKVSKLNERSPFGGCMRADNNRPPRLFVSRSLNIKIIFLNSIAFRLVPFCSNDFYRIIHGDNLITRINRHFINSTARFKSGLTLLFILIDLVIWTLKSVTSNNLHSFKTYKLVLEIG